MNAQIPLPSFNDIRKILQFWIDQQDKWFYFETQLIQSRSTGVSDVPNPLHNTTRVSWSRSSETMHYIQTRIVGKIYDVVSYPPSLLLSEVSVFTVDDIFDQRSAILVSFEKREKYGLVFSQISYYEPINDIELFLEKDPRVIKN